MFGANPRIAPAVRFHLSERKQAGLGIGHTAGEFDDVCGVGVPIRTDVEGYFLARGDTQVTSISDDVEMSPSGEMPRFALLYLVDMFTSRLEPV